MDPRLTRLVGGIVRLRRRLRGPLRPGWTEAMETQVFALQLLARSMSRLPVAWQREALRSFAPGGRGEGARYARVASKPPPDGRRVRVDADGVPCEWFARDARDRLGVLLYLHGGGYCLGSVDTHADLVSRLARASLTSALVIDYRLAPEHPFPAQLEDAVRAYRWLLAEGVPPARIALAGDSAGGGLVVSTLVALREAELPLPAAGACISPWVDLEASAASVAANEPFDYIDGRALRAFARRFVGPAERRGPDDRLRDPHVSPVHANLAGLPPLCIHAGDAEVLRDDAMRLAERAREQGVTVTLEIHDDMIHAFHAFAPTSRRARAAIDVLGAFVRRAIDDATGTVRLPRPG